MTMVTNTINQLRAPFLESTRDFPEDPKEMSSVLNRVYVDIANQVNIRTISVYPQNKPISTGETWYLANNKRYQSYRQIYTFTSLNVGDNLIPHNIQNIVQFTKIYGTLVSSVTPFYRPLPYLDVVTLTNGFSISVDNTNIHIVRGATASPTTNGIIVLEFLSGI